MINTVYQRTLKEQGLICTDTETIKKQDKVISFLIKKMGSNLIKGKSIMNVSLPVNIFDKRTLHQMYYIIYYNIINSIDLPLNFLMLHIFSIKHFIQKIIFQN